MLPSNTFPSPKGPAVPFENQNQDAHNLTGIVATGNDQRQARQVPVCAYVLRCHVSG